MKVSNFEEKKIFSEFIIENSNIPQIYVDEYWDYYINEFNLKNKWDTFIQDISEEKLTYESFKNELINFINKGYDILHSLWGENQTKKCEDILNKANPQIPLYNFMDIPDGKYLNVDIHNTIDVALRYIEVFDNKYTCTNDIVKQVSNSKIFTLKKIKMLLYDTLVDKQKDLYKIYSDVLAEKVYQSECPIIKQLNNNFELLGKTGGDNFLYKWEDDKMPQEMIGEYTYDDISFHIEPFIVKHLTIFGENYVIFIQYDRQNNIDTVRLFDCKCIPASLSLYPFALKLALGKDLNEKDLAIGYEDQIFFHFDKSEII